MGDPLSTYLHDHLAGSHFAVEMLKTLRDQHQEQPLGQFAASTLGEVEQDQQVLQGLVDRLGETSMYLKEATAWLAEKVSQFKLRHDISGELGTLQALETLALGIEGKLALWKALGVVTDDRVRGVDFERLSSRAEEQHQHVEEWRLQLARTAFVRAS